MVHSQYALSITISPVSPRSVSLQPSLMNFVRNVGYCHTIVWSQEALISIYTFLVLLAVKAVSSYLANT